MLSIISREFSFANGNLNSIGKMISMKFSFQFLKEFVENLQYSGILWNLWKIVWGVDFPRFLWNSVCHVIRGKFVFQQFMNHDNGVLFSMECVEIIKVHFPWMFGILFSKAFVENHFPVAGELTLERLARRDVSHFFLNSSRKSLQKSHFSLRCVSYSTQKI